MAVTKGDAQASLLDIGQTFLLNDPKFKTNSALVEVGESVTNLPDTFVIPALSGSVLKLEKTHN